MLFISTLIQNAKVIRADRAYDKMILESQKKLAETTPVSYSKVIA